MGVTAVGWLVDTVAAYEWGAAGVGVAAAVWEAGGGSISIGMEDVSLVHLEAGILALEVGEPRKVKRLPSLLEGPSFQPGAIVERKVQPERLGVWYKSWGKALIKDWWYTFCTSGRS